MQDFLSIAPDQINDELSHLSFPWWIASGWAIELFVGSYVRPHGDMDIAILRTNHTQLISELPNYEFKIARDGVLYEWNGSELPGDIHTLWSRKRGDEKWLTEFLINESSATGWMFRKNKSIHCLLEDMGMKTNEGIHFLRPAIPLLYKSAYCLDKDLLDFHAALPKMSKEEK